MIIVLLKIPALSNSPPQGRLQLSSFGIQLHRLDFCDEGTKRDTYKRWKYFQRWMSALLLASTRLTSLSLRTDGAPGPPVLGFLTLQHLDLTVGSDGPWLSAVIADLSFCSHLQTLKVAQMDLYHDHENHPPMRLPNLLLQDVASLKSLELTGFYPTEEFTLPAGCVLRLSVIVEECHQWRQVQSLGCHISMLYLVDFELQAWPAGLEEMSALQNLELYCTSMQEQDLAALQHIPHVFLQFLEYSTLLLTDVTSSGSLQSLKVSGKVGFNVRFSDIDAFVKGTQFIFKSAGQEAESMYRALRAACTRQGVGCYECEHTERDEDEFYMEEGVRVARLSNMKVCKAPKSANTYGHYEHPIPTDTDGWPC